VSARVRELEQILAQSSDTVAAMRDQGLDGRRSCDVPVERIRRLAAAIRALPDEALDEASSLAVRLLLDDCADAVGRLRGALRDTADRLGGTAKVLDACDKLLWQEHKLASKEAGDPVSGAGPDHGGA
jgi:hypothetical protein